MAKSKKSSKPVTDGKQKLTVPDDAIYYVVSNFLEKKTKTSGVPVLIGISTQTVEEVIGLFVDWAAANGYVRDGIMTIGGEKVG